MCVSQWSSLCRAASDFKCTPAGALDVASSFLSAMLTSDGVPSEACRPYTSGASGSAEDCNEFGPCADGSPKVMWYASSVSRITPFLEWSATELAIRTEVSSNGPVWAELQMVPDDIAAFVNYVPGTVFSCGDSVLCNLNLCRAHVVKILGYGTEAKTGDDYWLIWNPWGPQWGDSGLAKIKRGPNGLLNNGYCSIQASVYAAVPKLA